MTGMPQTKLFRWVVMMKKYVFSNNILFILYNYQKKKMMKIVAGDFRHKQR